MKKRILLIAGLFIFFNTLANAQNKIMRPIVYTMNIQMLEKNKSRVSAKDPLILPAYKLLLKDANKALEFGPVSVMEKKNTPPSGDKHDYMSLAPYHWPDPSKPNGLPYMRKDGQTNPEVKEYKDKEYMPKLCADVSTLAMAYYFSGEKVYAEHAAKLIRVWFLDTETRMNPNLNFAQAIKGINDGRGAGLIDSRHFIKLIDAIGLLQGSKYWSDKDQKGMQQWFADFLHWMQNSKNGISEMNADNNHGAWYDAQRLSMALFTENSELAKKIVLNARERLDKQMDDAGKFPREMERTISLHYTAFVMNAFFTIAQMSEETGIEFWNYTSPSGKSLKQAFNVLRPYLVQEKNWEGPQIKNFEYEDGYPLLMEAADRFNCKKCREAVTSLAGDKAGRLRIYLLY
ncbi:alginate lyase family protein [Sediminibacterium sp.]|uniref:alginate lyase family protein n=1 Tax=Sediminibacterium sp. TaxID=1917865 RepID=UPI0025DFBA8A|nr:alginate lyase family protein [Sediminibacterium sp.]MBW0178499.1 alginate lyase family protein [Sediminibacterium sp.]